MAKIAVLGQDTFHNLDPIDIKGNGPKSMKLFILAALAFAAYKVYTSKTL